MIVGTTFKSKIIVHNRKINFLIELFHKFLDKNFLALLSKLNMHSYCVYLREINYYEKKLFRTNRSFIKWIPGTEVEAGFVAGRDGHEDDGGRGE
jgi:hypothetical protein